MHQRSATPLPRTEGVVIVQRRMTATSDTPFIVTSHYDENDAWTGSRIQSARPVPSCGHPPIKKARGKR